MPTYDYTCAACGHRFERFESIHDDGTKPCEKCKKKKARRMMGMGAGLIFKGSGFYTTDYKSSTPSESSSSSDDAGSGSKDSGSSSSDSGESKPESGKGSKKKKESKK